MRGDDLQAVHRLTLEERGQRRGVRGLLARHQVQRSAMAERGEDRGVAEVRSQRGHGGEARRVRQLQPARDALHVVDELPMLDGHALRPAGGARGEDDVGEVLRCRHGHGVRIAPPGQHGCVRVEADDRSGAPSEAFRQRRLRDERPCSRVREDGAQALEGEGRVQGHVGATRLEDAPQAHQGTRGAVQVQAHRHLGAHAQLAQVVRQLVRTPVELPVRQARVLGDDGLGIRSPRRLSLEEGLHGDGCEGGVGVVPLHEEPLPLHVDRQRQGRQPRIRSADGRLQQHAQVPHQPVHRVLMVEVAVVRDADGEPLRQLGQRQRQVELRRPGVRVHARQRQPRQPQLRRRRVLQDEHHLEQRAAVQVPLGLELLHQLLERHVLVGVGPQRHLARLRHELPEGGVATEPRPQHERVDEEADEALRLRPGAIGDGRAHAHVVLPRVARQHRLEGREQHHEGRRAFAVRQRLRGLPQLARPQEAAALAGERLHRGAWLVRGQLQHGRGALELVLPVRELGVEHLILQPLALPHRVVRVLERQLGQRRRQAPRARFVQRSRLAHEDVHRPAVGHDVVHHQHQHVLLLRQLEQRRPQQRPVLQAERALGLLGEDACRFRCPLFCGCNGEVLGPQAHVCLGRDDLHG